MGLVYRTIRRQCGSATRWPWHGVVCCGAHEWARMDYKAMAVAQHLAAIADHTLIGQVNAYERSHMLLIPIVSHPRVRYPEPAKY